MTCKEKLENAEFIILLRIITDLFSISPHEVILTKLPDWVISAHNTSDQNPAIQCLSFLIPSTWLQSHSMIPTCPAGLDQVSPCFGPLVLWSWGRIVFHCVFLTSFKDNICTGNKIIGISLTFLFFIVGPNSIIVMLGVWIYFTSFPFSMEEFPSLGVWYLEPYVVFWFSGLETRGH